MVFLPSITLLPLSLTSYYFGTRKLLKHPGETEVRIFKILPKYINDALSARKFVDILLPVLANGAQDSGSSISSASVFIPNEQF